MRVSTVTITAPASTAPAATPMRISASRGDARTTRTAVAANSAHPTTAAVKISSPWITQIDAVIAQQQQCVVAREHAPHHAQTPTTMSGTISVESTISGKRPTMA